MAYIYSKKIFNDVFIVHTSPIGDKSKLARLHFKKWRRALVACGQFHMSLISISDSWIFDVSTMSLLTCHHPISDFLSIKMSLIFSH
jgi:hypothetical protein